MSISAIKLHDTSWTQVHRITTVARPVRGPCLASLVTLGESLCFLHSLGEKAGLSDFHTSFSSVSPRQNGTAQLGLVGRMSAQRLPNRKRTVPILYSPVCLGLDSIFIMNMMKFFL